MPSRICRLGLGRLHPCRLPASLSPWLDCRLGLVACILVACLHPCRLLPCRLHSSCGCGGGTPHPHAMSFSSQQRTTPSPSGPWQPIVVVCSLVAVHPPPLALLATNASLSPASLSPASLSPVFMRWRMEFNSSRRLLVACVLVACSLSPASLSSASLSPLPCRLPFRLLFIFNMEPMLDPLEPNKSCTCGS